MVRKKSNIGRSKQRLIMVMMGFLFFCALLVIGHAILSWVYLVYINQ